MIWKCQPQAAIVDGPVGILSKNGSERDGRPKKYSRHRIFLIFHEGVMLLKLQEWFVAL